MIAHVQMARLDEPPSPPPGLLAGKLCQALLLILCASPIAIFAFALAHRAAVFLLQ